MTESIVDNTNGKEEILEVLQTFEKNSKISKNKSFKKRKYECATKLSPYQKNDLETVKTDIEYSSDDWKILIAISATLGVIVQVWISSWNAENLKFILNSGITLFLSGVIIFAWFEVGKLAKWLHIVKIAITQKNGDASQNVKAQSTGLPRDVSAKSEVLVTFLEPDKIDSVKLRQLIDRLETIEGIQKGFEEVNSRQSRPVEDFALEMQQKYGISG